MPNLGGITHPVAQEQATRVGQPLLLFQLSEALSAISARAVVVVVVSVVAFAEALLIRRLVLLLILVLVAVAAVVTAVGMLISRAVLVSATAVGASLLAIVEA